MSPYHDLALTNRAQTRSSEPYTGDNAKHILAGVVYRAYTYVDIIMLLIVLIHRGVQRYKIMDCAP